MRAKNKTTITDRTWTRLGTGTQTKNGNIITPSTGSITRTITRTETAN